MILSYLATLGISLLVFRYVFGQDVVDPEVALIVFIFLVALGADYNIFLMSRVREEAQQHGTSEGMLRALVATGPVITSAGLILAGTFCVLAVLPIWELVEIGFAVALGVLIDTFVVRSILVPAIVWKLGEQIWWPSTAKGGKRALVTGSFPIISSEPEAMTARVWITDGSWPVFSDTTRLRAKHPALFGLRTRYEGFVDPAVPRGSASVRAEREDDALYVEAEWLVEFPDGIDRYLQEPGLVDAATEITVQGMIEGKWMNRLLGTTAWRPASLGQQPDRGGAGPGDLGRRARMGRGRLDAPVVPHRRRASCAPTRRRSQTCAATTRSG